MKEGDNLYKLSITDTGHIYVCVYIYIYILGFQITSMLAITTIYFNSDKE